MENLNLTALYPYLKTRKDARDLTRLLENVAGKLFNNNLEPEKVIQQELPYELTRIIRQELALRSINLDDKKNLQQFFADLENAITKLPVIHIILAIAPTEELIKTINNWFFTEFEKIILLEITIDKSLIGGSVISFNGRANDYSLSSRIGQMV